LKPPTSTTKDGTPSTGPGGRKTSISQRDLSSYSASSPSSARPGVRRRETGDSTTLPNPLSPSGNTRFFRDEPNTSTPPPALLRRKTDYKDPNAESKTEEKEKETPVRDSSTDNQGFGSLKRSTTAPMSAGLNGPASPWSTAPTSGFSPMGAFGNFSLGPGASQSPAGDKKPALGSIRGESRFKGLLSKDSSEDMTRVKEKSSFGSLERLPETETDRSRQSEGFDNKARALRSESNPFGDEDHRVGSAALGGAQDMSPPGQGIDHLGFSAFGLASKPSNFRDFMSQEYPQHQTPQGPRHGQEPMSPTNTNPYQSPEQDKGDGEDVDTDGSDIQQSHLPGLTGLQHDSNIPPFGSYRRGGPSSLEASADRSQNSSAGANRGFPNIGGFPGLTGMSSAGGWPGTAGAIGSPSRGGPGGFSTGFGDSLFGPMGDLPSPNIGGLSGSGFFGSPGGAIGTGTIGRGSKMGSLFPAAMQEQMQGRQGRQSGDLNDQSEPVGRTLRGSSSVESGSLRGDPDGSLRGRGLFGDMLGSDSGNRMRGFEDPLQQGDPSVSLGPSQPSMMSPGGQFGGPDPGVPSHTSAPSLDATSQPGQTQSQSGDSPASNQLPTSQQRQMVMPDRMRWIYRDPQGNKQGPWSGLEMHDWYKAGFFTAELQVKKLEDHDYEPLAQLIRRIGNSREPFLVPQIGVPHGPPSNQPNQWAPATTGTLPPTTQAGVAQPPFANSFPSFGTTLTAEQQNALERRKQEEQYLMARQKEHLAQQQVMLKQMQQLQGGPHGIHSLQHHSSAHSLHSQPSFGSITSPSGGYQPSPNQGPIQPPQPVPGFFENPLRQSGGPGMGSSGFNADMLNHVPREELPGLLERMNLGRGGQLPFSTGPSFGARPQENPTHAQQVSSMLQDRARLQREQEQHDAQATAEQQAHTDRLRQFHALQSQNEEMHLMRGSETIPEGLEEPTNDFFGRDQDGGQHVIDPAIQPELSLAEQVQMAAAASSNQSPITQNESPWGKIESMPQPFPPPQSASPLPAPAAQRNRQNVADQLAAESRSQSQTPIETPSSSIAPWAKESTEGTKGPSLKEIQEAEARKAAQQEEIAAAARRALAEQERMVQPVPAAPGLPLTSTWGSSGSPSTPTSTGSVWAKPATGKTTATANAKKTLAQIQKEEEARKQRLAAANAAQQAATNIVGVPGVMTGGKRYADLAGKIAPSVPTTGSAWTTVGASGKVKMPSTPVVATPVGPRSVSGGNIPIAAAAPKTRPATTTRVTSTSGATTNQTKANDEFTKWAKSSLSKGLNITINGESRPVPSRLTYPPSPSINPTHIAQSTTSSPNSLCCPRRLK
jgi:PERQ amino acid-rich with GYF domain-containing protein